MAMAHPATRRRSSHVEAETIEASRRPASVSPEDRKVQIAAAKARVTVDKLIGDETPDWIIALSKETPE